MNDKRKTVTIPAYGTLAMAISAALGTTGQARAQNVMEEIIVTATKRAESLQDISQSVTAFSSDMIERRNFKGLEDFAAFIPGLAQSQIEPGGNTIVFRGVAASGLQFGANPSSGLYLDEQPITSAGRNPDPRLIDIERIEALSGPQGTLFGDASQSGTLRIITNKPDPTEFSGWVDGAISSVKSGDIGYDTSVMINVPLAENKLALRVVGFTSEEAGFVDNVLGTSQGGTFDNSDVVGNDINDSSFYGGRVALRWEPTDDWIIDLAAIFQDLEGDGFGDTNLDVGDLEQVRFKEETFEENWQQYALTVQKTVGMFDVTVTGSYFEKEFEYNADATDYQVVFNQLSTYIDSLYPYYDLTFYDFGGDPRAFAFDLNEEERRTFEARIATNGTNESRWNGVVGYFYNKTESSALFASGNDSFAGSPAFYYLAYNPYNLSINGLPPGSWAPTDNWFFGVYDTEIEQKALFGEVTFDLTEQFSITAGGRWFEVKRDFELFQGSLQQGSEPSLETDFIINNALGTSEVNDFVPKASVSYRFNDDKMIYATYSEGFRSGGANALRSNSILPRTFDSDTLENFEIGVKTTWFDGHFRANINAYFMDWKDIQIQASDPQPNVFALGFVNFPEASINGVEADFAWVPGEGWDISANVGYVDAQVSETAVLFGEEDGTPVVAMDGTPLPLAPDWKGALSVQYTFQQPLFEAEPYARLDYAYTGDSINALTGLESVIFAPSASPQENYSVLHFSAGLDAENWSAGVSIKNLTNEDGDVYISNRWGKQRRSTNRPRTIGVNFRWNF